MPKLKDREAEYWLEPIQEWTEMGNCIGVLVHPGEADRGFLEFIIDGQASALWEKSGSGLKFRLRSTEPFDLRLNAATLISPNDKLQPPVDSLHRTPVYLVGLYRQADSDELLAVVSETRQADADPVYAAAKERATEALARYEADHEKAYQNEEIRLGEFDQMAASENPQLRAGGDILRKFGTMGSPVSHPEEPHLPSDWVNLLPTAAWISPLSKEEREEQIGRVIDALTERRARDGRYNVGLVKSADAAEAAMITWTPVTDLVSYPEAVSFKVVVA